MPDETVLTNFQNIRLTFKQFKILRSFYKKSQSHDHKPLSPREDSDLFQGPPDIENGGMDEFIGVVPESIRIFAHLGLLDPLNPELNPIKNDKKVKTYIITPLGIMFYIFYRERLFLNYLPLLISFLSMILSIATLIIAL